MSGEIKERELQAVSVVAVGRFNPAIFQPLWFSSNNLIRPEEADKASIELIHKQVAIFSTEWFSMQVTEDRFSVETQDPTKYKPLQDLVLGTFKILEHTPVDAVGFNSNEHYRMDSEDEWHAFGNHYAPKASWQSILTNPGMRSLTIEGKRRNCDAQQIRVKIEPSRKVHPGINIHVNEHYDLADNKELGPADRIVRLLKVVHGSWEPFMSYSNTVAEHLWAEYKQD